MNGTLYSQIESEMMKMELGNPTCPTIEVTWYYSKTPKIIGYLQNVRVLKKMLNYLTLKTDLLKLR
jgi:hypothetical protein